MVACVLTISASLPVSAMSLPSLVSDDDEAVQSNLQSEGIDGGNTVDDSTVSNPTAPVTPSNPVASVEDLTGEGKTPPEESVSSHSEETGEVQTETIPSNGTSAAAVNRISFADWSIPSIRIPDSTTMVSKGVVLNGAITYEVVVRARVYNNGSRYASAPVSWSTTELSSNVKILSSNGRTDYNGYAEVTLQVRNISRVSLKLSCDNASATKIINFGTKATYTSNFKTTQYITALESDRYYTGNKQSVRGLTGTYKSDFIKDVMVQGSGLGENGKYVKYYNGVFSHQPPTTATGTTPRVGTTIAVDPYYVPCVIKSGTTYRGHVDILGGIGRRIAEDRGGKITGHHIDIYVGTGRSNLKGTDGNYRVLFCGVNTWGTDAVRPTSESDELFAFLDFQDETDFPLSTPKEIQSENQKYLAYISDIDYSRANSITVTVSNKSTARSTSETTDFALNRLALSVDEMSLSDDNLIVIGHINPSLDVYQKFDVSTKELVEEYYGYDFIEDGERIFFVQAPQHFSGLSGHNRIMDSNGNMFYESGDGVIIGNTHLDGTILSFDEMDISTNEVRRQSIDISIAPVLTPEIGYYDFTQNFENENNV